MKLAICIRDGLTMRSLGWINESRAGLYFGIFANDIDIHMSYHADGRKHYKSGNTYHQRQQDTPLTGFIGYRQLLHQTFSIPNAESDFWPKHRVFGSWDSMIVVDEKQVAGDEWIAMDVWLHDSPSFAVVERRVSKSVRDTVQFRGLSSSYHKLVNFPGLSLGINLRSAHNI